MIMTEVKTAFKSTDFEHEVMLCLLEDPSTLYDELRYQYRNATILRRERSLFSNTTYYSLENGVQAMRRKNLVIDDLKAEVAGCQEELDVKLVVRRGFLSHMEITERSGHFPQMPSLLTVYRGR
jgi:hypothetical protein